MVTKRRKPRPLFIREWRKFMGTKVIDLAVALGIERESYYRLERAPYKFNNEEMVILADEMGVSPDQFWFAPPVPGTKEKVSIDGLLQNFPEDTQRMALAAIRGMIGK
jgi:transcriptional regulator with XRE-family HTH domain